MKRKFFNYSNADLASLIEGGNSDARAEGMIRLAKWDRLGKKGNKAVRAALASTPAPAPAPTPAPAPESAPDIAGMIKAAVDAALAAHGVTAPAPAPEPETHTNDRAVWEQCLADANGYKWEAYDRMEKIIGKRQRHRISKASGKTVGTIANGISKFRRGIAPDLSFVGK